MQDEYEHQGEWREKNIYIISTKILEEGTWIKSSPDCEDSVRKVTESEFKSWLNSDQHGQNTRN